MCTVTYIPVNDKYFISSNRDEKNSRSQAAPPAVYKLNNIMLIFPKDADAGGSWIALHENGNAAVLLNGAFEKHNPLPPYKKKQGPGLFKYYFPGKAREIFSSNRPVAN